MIQRVCEQQLPISGVLLQRRDLVHLEISPDEWRILEDIIKLLEPFKIATQHLSGERYPTISALGPLLKQIQKKVTVDVNDSVAVREFKKALRDDMDSRYRNPDVQLLFHKSSFLDPRFKSLTHLPVTLKEEVIDMLLDETFKFMEDNAIEIQSTDATPPNLDEPVRKKKKNALEELIGDQFLTHGDGAVLDNSMDIVRSEVFRYKAEPSIPVDQNPLKWWEAHHYLYPNLSTIARKYLCIVATSVPSEQLFSTAGNVVSSKRAALLPENVDKLVFLHDNLPPLHLDYKRAQVSHCTCEQCTCNN